MKRTLRFAFVALMAMVMGNAYGQGTTFDFDNDYAKLFPNLPGVSTNETTDGDFNEATTSTAVNGFTVTVSPKEESATNANRIWTAAPRLRMYSGTLTIKGKGIKRIDFTHKDGNFNFTASTGKLEGNVWTGEADEVVFTCSRNTQINKIVINGEGGSDTPVTPETKAINVAKALETIAALADGATTSEKYQVKGFIVGTPDFQRRDDGTLYGNVNCDIADEKGGTNLLTVFRGKNFGNQNFTEETISTLKEGDEVVFEGELQKYVKNGVTTPEIKNCYLISINGKDAASVKAVRSDLDANAPAYNVGGQKVSDNYRGLVIQNGRKYINK